MTRLEEALECLRYDLQEEEYRVQVGMGAKLQRILNDYIEEETNFDSQRHKLTKRTLISAFQDAVIEVAEETHEEDAPNLDSLFQDKKGEVLRETLGHNLITYTIVFPLNLRESSKIPDSFSTPNADFERISETEWREEYEEPARNQDETSLVAFLEESPNDLYESDGLGGVFTYWKTEYDSRDHHYALSRIPEIVRLLLGKLNFVLWERSADVPQPASNERPPNARWSQLKEPFVYLVFDGDEYLNYWPYDYDLRRGSEGGRRDTDKRMEKFGEFPDLSAAREDLSSVDEFLANAILAYQDGITESSVHQSFFAFWRGIENLAQVERGQAKEVAVDRALFALESMTEKGVVREELQEAIKEIYGKRNELVHQGPHTGISRYHRAAAKILLDVLIELYIYYYEEGYSAADYRRLLEYGTRSAEEREETIRVINEIKELLEESEED
ncbi:hypothetical protein ACFO5R_02605 [Halosolutus amylolyticus]|uniref:Apea-like HEPN domain-containing protein n=1 Tax=Halosolutus amylolyticus TaxID=2932267 RepID=A0ABD5PKE4_9EURY|nr:hypothetical protein [Halosolutus amylolyticus]